MRGLLVLVGVLSVLLVVGGIAVVGTIITRSSSGHPAATFGGAAGMGHVILDQPSGTRIVGVAQIGTNLAVVLQGGGPDRVVVVNGVTGREAGSVSLAR